MLNHYLAFTIGPIYRTMDSARFTRELWASSYLFSYLVKNITRRIRTSPALSSAQFIIPAVVDGLDDLFKSVDKRVIDAHGAGLFPDRFILQADGPDCLDALKRILDDALTDLARQTEKAIGYKGGTEAIETYLKNYLQLYALELALPQDANVILPIMRHLDTLELQRSITPTDRPFLRDLFDRVTKSFLVLDAFGQEHSFETILEVAARDFADLSCYQAIGNRRRKEPKPADSPGVVSFADIEKVAQLEDWQPTDSTTDDTEPDPLAEETSLIAYLTRHHAATSPSKQKPVFQPAHKYIAVVQADGDNVGRVISQLQPGQYLPFSKTLGDFALNAVGMIADYGGMNIYAGGDDLLFFAPVLRHHSVGDSMKKETIFDLLKRLNATFTEAFSRFPVEEGADRPTLSFGLSITYYKFPLYEARQAAATQLFGKAKKIDKKNAIGLRVQKHSGQPFGGTFRMNTQSFGHLMTLLNTPVDGADRMLTSVVYKIRENAYLLCQIGLDKETLQCFFTNSFNEAIHREQATFLTVVADLLHDCFTEHGGGTKEALDAAYTLLRMYGFLTSTELK